MLSPFTFNKSRVGVVAFAACLAMVPGRDLRAPFVWLDSENQPEQSQAVLFFGEAPSDRDYRLPPPIAETKVVARDAAGNSQEVATAAAEDQDFVGLRGTVELADPFSLEAVQCYGVYHGSLLTYHAKHLHGKSPDDWSRLAPSPGLALEVLPAIEDGKLVATVLWKGKPLPGAEITLVHGANTIAKRTTDEQGRTSLSSVTIPGRTEGAVGGKVGLLVQHKIPAESGEWKGKKYMSSTHYATLTVDLAGEGATAGRVTAAPTETVTAEPRSATSVPSKIPALPVPISSFGAAIHKGWLYVYGGHTGEAHAHSRDHLSPHFLRFNLDGGTVWESLPMRKPLQGLALVADGDYLYCIGGMQARNAEHEEADLHSVADVARFEPVSKTWTDLSPLPEPRSSHDAFVMQGQVHVVGGWKLAGSGEGEWHRTAWISDPSATVGELIWRPIASPPFASRALSVAESQGRLIAIGGMHDDGKISQHVYEWDPQQNQWSTRTDFPGTGMHGFGTSATTMAGHLFACGVEGTVYRLDADHWLPCGQAQTARFFHRLVTPDSTHLLLVGGASMTTGHRADSESFFISTTPQPSE